MKVAIVTDSNSGITQESAKELGIFVIPMPAIIDGKIFYEDITLTQEQFYEKLESDASVSTSQPNPEDVAVIWKDALASFDEVVCIPMSSGLSETCHTLSHYAANKREFAGKVFVVDNQRISITQKQSVYDAVKLANEGKRAKEICDYLLKTKLQSSIYIMVDTLKYLKKGGRLTPAAAAIGTILHIKPILQIQGAKLDKYDKSRKLSDAKRIMIGAVKKDLEGRFAALRQEGKIALHIAHTKNLDEAETFKAELMEIFPDLEVEFIDPLSLSVSCHIGPGALAVGCTIKY